MRYEMISADCHIDLCWLPPDLFTANASTGLRDRMPHVTDGPKGPAWVTSKGAALGLMNGMGSAGREYIPGQIHRSDRMASTGLYDDGKRGILRGLDIANSLDMLPLWDPQWTPLWDVVNEARLPVHFHTVGGQMPDLTKLPPLLGLMARAVHITGFQMHMATILTSLIFGGVLERYPAMRVVIGESGIGWIPYVLERMDAEWEEQFKDLGLSLPPSEYWRRQCKATYQTDRVGIKLLDEIGVDNVMWGSDFPHPDGVWPDSREFIQRELGHLAADVRRKIVCENAGKFYGFIR